MILAATGHRLDKLGGYDLLIQLDLLKFSKIVLPQLKPDKVISGMALGFDQAIAEAAYQLKIPYVAAVPFVGQESVWPEEAQIKYKYIDKVKCLYLFVGGINKDQPYAFYRQQ